MKPSLWDCFNAKVYMDRIYCCKGHKLTSWSEDGNINLGRAERGKTPLEFSVCVNCSDFDPMGDPIPLRERGW